MNGNNGLYFIVGALVVVVCLGAYAMFGVGHHRPHEFGGATIERSVTRAPDGDRTVTITREH